MDSFFFSSLSLSLLDFFFSFRSRLLLLFLSLLDLCLEPLRDRERRLKEPERDLLLRRRLSLERSRERLRRWGGGDILMRLLDLCTEPDLDLDLLLRYDLGGVLDLFLSLDLERLRLTTRGERVLDLRLSRDLERRLERDLLLLGDLDLRRDLDLLLDRERLLRLFLRERDLDLLDLDRLRLLLSRDRDLDRFREGDFEDALFVSAAAEISFWASLTLLMASFLCLSEASSFCTGLITLVFECCTLMLRPENIILFKLRALMIVR